MVRERADKNYESPLRNFVEVTDFTRKRCPPLNELDFTILSGGKKFYASIFFEKTTKNKQKKTNKKKNKLYHRKFERLHHQHPAVLRSQAVTKRSTR